MAHQIAIALQQLSRYYGQHLVLQDINLTITRGKVVALHGSNGTGKTTLLKVIATALRPSYGHGHVMGYDLKREPASVRQHVAYLSVLGGSYGDLSALENLRFASTLFNQRTSKAQLMDILNTTGLKDACDKRTRTFSSGMKKRLAIARLLLSDAPLWLLDEPYAALDESGRDLIDHLLITARTEGRTVLIASHELNRSRQHADAIMQLSEGKLQRLV